jgi:hypothetical protein
VAVWQAVRDRKNLVPVVFAQRIFLPYGDMLMTTETDP